MAPETPQLDSRRLRHGDELRYCDYVLEFGDAVAMESSAFRGSATELKLMGFDKIEIGPTDEDEGLWVSVFRTIPNTESLANERNGGNLRLIAEVLPDGSRSLFFAIGAANEVNAPPGDLHEAVWRELDRIQEILKDPNTELPLKTDESPLA